ncbi:hypothetical protein RA280_24560 [Cupriavidus sp. CV2]|uniref:hypothetical protein n=1 Tax=Cupriavidus ulmosensis TaxID=3065913 RepID=UPI00296AD67F|nr:hypothetical protein [Cupriavidus sp. CV2]MDW3684866.1 hypothetical protein [Cupriavidus sp. CV2]
MNWPLRTPVRAADRLNADIVDLAADSSDLKRQNAQLRKRLAETESLLAIAREANVAQAVLLQRLEQLARAIKDGAAKNPLQPLARWVKFGPEAAFLASLMKPQQDQ